MDEGAQGRHVNASPPRRRTPDPSVVRMPLFRWKPSVVQASMLVAGAVVLRRTSRAPKSVCVSSVLAGPRSWDFGAPVGVRGTEETGEEVVKVRLGRKRCGFGEWAARQAGVAIRGRVTERRARRRSREGARIVTIVFRECSPAGASSARRH